MRHFVRVQRRGLGLDGTETWLIRQIVQDLQPVIEGMLVLQPRVLLEAKSFPAHDNAVARALFFVSNFISDVSPKLFETLARQVASRVAQAVVGRKQILVELVPALDPGITWKLAGACDHGYSHTPAHPFRLQTPLRSSFGRLARTCNRSETCRHQVQSSRSPED
jgi:hypothetical protein